MAPPRVFSALPARPLHGRPPGAVAATCLGLLSLLMFGSMLLFLLVQVTPGLVTDWQVRGTARALRDGTVTDSDCGDTEMLQICNMTVSAPVNEGRMTRRVHDVFVTNGDRLGPIGAVADPARPDAMTTDLALDRFWNRVASFVAGLLFLGALTGGGVWAGLRILLRGRAWRLTGALPVPLRLVSRQRVHNGQIWVVQGDDGQTERWPVSSRRAEPFLLSDGRILGLQRIDGTAIMPLDARLRWVDLTRRERETVLGTA